ncbi:MAG: stage II sporulation protein R [Defluviitaleaceae bacterium]|nr:stage II sporulation protein R [Defluviitaleaceae bacterium]
MKNFQKEIKILAAAVCFGIFFAAGAAAWTYVYSETTQRNIAENVIRFHVRAHSDAAEDQRLKEIVRSEILNRFAENFSNCENIDDSRAIFEELLPEMKSYAENIIRNEGFDCEVSVSMTNLFFPTQLYGNIAFPPGIYEAVQIVIGDGAGQNWWCLMFPPLCYVDMTAGDEARTLLAQNVSEEGFLLLTHFEEPEFAVRFKIVEWWQNRNRDFSSPIRQIVRR